MTGLGWLSSQRIEGGETHSSHEDDDQELQTDRAKRLMKMKGRKIAVGLTEGVEG